jgi:alpha-1,2-mannosyltransferase
VATNIRADWVLLGAPLLVLSHPAISAFEFGSQSFVVAALVTWGAGLMWRRDSRLGGAVLGLAITMKVWPALLLIPLWGRARRQGVLIALAVGGGLNLLASLVFGFSPADIWQGMTSAGEAWVGFAGNGSLASRLVMLGVSVSMATVLSFFVLLPVLHQLWNRTVDFQLVLWGTVLCAVLLSPLSWDHYNLALLPLAIILALRAGNWFDLRRWALLGWAGLTLGGRFVRLVIDRPIEIAGALAFTERALLLVALMLVVFGVRRANRLGSVDPAETLDSVDDTAFVIPDSLRSNERPVA